MTSSATTRNRLEKQGTGDNANTWGTYLNSSIDLIDAALDGRTAFTLSGAKTLSSANYSPDESRERFLDITGGTGGTVTIPAVEKWYIVRNNASGDAVFTTGSGVTQTVKPGSVTLLVSDGTNIRAGVDKYYVDNLVTNTAFASALPLQAGNAGKYVTTDGATASWSSLATVATSGAYSDLTGRPTNVSAFANDAAYVDAAGARGAISVSGALTYNAATGVVGYTPPTFPTGTIVGTTDTQTLSNKTLTDPKISLGGSNGTSGQILVSQGAGLAPIWQTLGISGFSNMVVFTGSGTWTIPLGVTKAKVTVVGGGGGGGGGFSSSTGGSGGSAGGAAIKIYTLSGSTASVVVGSGGGGGAGGGNSGNSGGSSSFTNNGVTVSASGGAGGDNSTTAFAGGNGSGGDVNFVGGSGEPYSGVGSTMGGASILGAGGATRSNSGDKNNAGYGGGGGGGEASSSSTAQQGGNGRSGIVIIEY